jgi:hypothetical protein
MNGVMHLTINTMMEAFGLPGMAAIFGEIYQICMSFLLKHLDIEFLQSFSSNFNTIQKIFFFHEK